MNTQNSLRTRLGVEDLEGRAMPSAVLPRPQMVDPALVHVAVPPGRVYLAGASVATQLHHPGKMRVVSRIEVNGELVMRMVGRPRFAAIGPALSCDENGNVVKMGGMTLSVRGREIGTFAEKPTVTRDWRIHINRFGIATRVLTYHIHGPLYLAPPETNAEGLPWSAPVVG